ncbi:hypothetical protein Tco_0783294 [Tanacetum coccineum]
MNDPNINMEEYIRLEEEKARKRKKVFNWETVKYAIAFNDSLKSSETLSCEPTVSSLNDEIDFKISFDDSDDEDYKMGCFDDLDFFKDFENEFPAIVYNDAPTSKSDLLTEPILSPQHIDEFDLNDETPLSKFDEEEQNVLYFNDPFPFNIIHTDDLKSEKDNGDNEIDIIQSFRDYYKDADGAQDAPGIELCFISPSGTVAVLILEALWCIEIIMEIFNMFRLQRQVIDLDTSWSLYIFVSVGRR